MDDLKNEIKHEMRHHKNRPDKIYEFMLRCLDFVTVTQVTEHHEHHHYPAPAPQVAVEEPQVFAGKGPDEYPEEDELTSDEMV